MVTHPKAAPVVMRGEDGVFRLVAMEHVEGTNLAEEVTRLRANRGAEDNDHPHLPSSNASDYFRSVAETIRQAAYGLAFVHQNGIVHRDIKPGSLLLDGNGGVTIVAFGLARVEEQGNESTSGDLIETPHYMSPEQARGQKHEIDHRTDIYSLGVVLYELLTLRRPFEGKTSYEVITNLLRHEPPRIRKVNPRVPHALEIICTTAMAREPERRYPSASVFADDLASFLHLDDIRVQAEPR